MNTAIIISTRSDLVTYLRDVRPDLEEHTTGLTERVVDALLSLDDRPDYGASWDAWSAWFAYNVSIAIEAILDGDDAHTSAPADALDGTSPFLLDSDHFTTPASVCGVNPRDSYEMFRVADDAGNTYIARLFRSGWEYELEGWALSSARGLREHIPA